MLHTDGIESVRLVLRKHCKLAKVLGNMLNNSNCYEVVAKVDYGLVCIRPVGDVYSNNEAMVVKLLDYINKDNKTFMVHCCIKGKNIIRISIAHPLFNDEDIDWVVDHLTKSYYEFNLTI